MIFQSYDHKCTATFLWFTVYNSDITRELNCDTRVSRFAEATPSHFCINYLFVIFSSFKIKI